MTEPPPRKNSFGIAALVLGLCALPTGFAMAPGGIGLSVLAIILGARGVNRAKVGLATNMAMARWGMWLGIIGTAVTVFWLAYLWYIAHYY